MSDDGAKWLTFQALAEARGTSKRAAVVLVRRHKWPKRTNNAGHVTALVPAEWATAQDEKVADRNATPHDAPTDAAHAIAVLERTVEALREAHAQALALAQDRAERAEQRLAEVKAAEARRRGQGRWARLRSAWRGSKLS
jgi:hypothetical protein